MAKDLTNSTVDRQNILNNQYALNEIQKAVNIAGIVFEGKMVFFKEQVADFFEVTGRTIEAYLANYGEELAQNGYEILRGKRLKLLKLHIKNNHDTEINFGDMKIPQIGIFDFGSRYKCAHGYKIAALRTGVSEIYFLNTILLHWESLMIAESFTPKWFYIGSQEQDSIT